MRINLLAAVVAASLLQPAVAAEWVVPTPAPAGADDVPVRPSPVDTAPESTTR